MARSVSFGELFAETNALVSRQGGFLVAAALAITVSFVGLDWLSTLSDDASGLMMANSLAGFAIGLFGQYLIVERLLADRRQTGQATAIRHYGSLFGVLFISGLGIVAGLIVLLLPGFYLAGRWLTATQRVVEGRLPSMEALRASWDDSEPSQFVFTVAYLLSLLPILLIVGVSFYPDLLAIPDDAWLTNLLINGFSAIANVAGWVISTAAYRQAVPVDSQLEEVFV